MLLKEVDITCEATFIRARSLKTRVLKHKKNNSNIYRVLNKMKEIKFDTL